MDAGENAVVNYHQVGKMHMTLTEGLDDIEMQPFLVNKATGVVSLNFDPQRGMKGYFDFMVSEINDTYICNSEMNIIKHVHSQKYYTSS